MYQSGLFQNRQCVEKLCHEALHELCAEALKLVLLDELIEVRGEKFKDQAKVTSVDERVP